MSRSPLSLSLFVPSAAVLALAASCNPVERHFTGSGGAGGASTTSVGGLPTTGEGPTTGPTSSGMASTSSGMASTSSGMASTSSGACGDTENDAHNCGTCGHDCAALPNVASASCSAGKCVLTCTAGHADCIPGADDGCESITIDDPQSCGCGAVKCTLPQTCTAGACVDHFTSCAMTGNCADPACQTDMRFSIDFAVAVDLNAGRRIWQRVTKGPLDYPTAVSYCASLTLDGVNSGWRLPSGSELASILVKPGGLMGCSTPYCAPAIDQATFGGTVVDEYWTTDPYMNDSHYCVSFCDGRKTPYKEVDTSAHYVRCVHDPLP